MVCDFGPHSRCLTPPLWLQACSVSEIFAHSMTESHKRNRSTNWSPPSVPLAVGLGSLFLCSVGIRSKITVQHTLINNKITIDCSMHGICTQPTKRMLDALWRFWRQAWCDVFAEETKVQYATLSFWPPGSTWRSQEVTDQHTHVIAKLHSTGCNQQCDVQKLSTIWKFIHPTVY